MPEKDERYLVINQGIEGQTILHEVSRAELQEMAKDQGIGDMPGAESIVYKIEKKMKVTRIEETVGQHPEWKLHIVDPDTGEIIAKRERF